jgi:5-formaminoimidazole-4-carboxamide-1-(beta)-D-ribofuranosyl 5'-monophosphate synthetase
MTINKTLELYDSSNLAIASLGGHSALDICRGAKDEGFKTVVVAESGREKTYAKHYKTEGLRGSVDEVILVDSFADIIKPAVQKKLIERNAILINSRYFWVYCDAKKIEKDFNVPVFGNKFLVRKEERDEDKNQYFLLNSAKIPTPKRFAKPEDINSLAMVKASEKTRSYERGFFLASSFEDYQKKSAELVKSGEIDEGSLKNAVIEEFVVGPQINFNFFYSPLSGRIELLGTDMRRQTNYDGLLRLTAPEQIEVLKHVHPRYIENGHQAVTVKESLLEQAFDYGERFADAVKKHYPPGMLGPFALQGAVVPGPPKEQFVVFDVSLRIPGSPGSFATPYSGYLHGENISVGRRVAREIKQAKGMGKLSEIVT